MVRGGCRYLRNRASETVRLRVRIFPALDWLKLRAPARFLGRYPADGLCLSCDGFPIFHDLEP